MSLTFTKLGFSPFTRKMLENPKVRHEIGQGEETDQTRQMKDMETEYEELKEKVAACGKQLSSCAFCFYLVC